MFSAEASLHGTAPSTSLRNPRRRPRQISADGSGTLPRAKRQRSIVNDDNFSGTGSAEMDVDRASSHDTTSTTVSRRRRGNQSLKMVMRERKVSDRGSKDNGTVLTKNDNYVVTKLPAFPDYVRKNTKEHLRGVVSAATSHALLLTPAQALVWSYTAPHSSPETFSFGLPNPTPNTTDAIPLGALVSPSASSAEPGLVVVMPTSGKIVFWDSISRAASQEFFRQQKQGVQGSVGSLMSGETVVAIENAEPAGFILGFSSGRVAHLSVTDAQGRPTASVTFIRNARTASSAGLFGSLRNALGGAGWRRDVAAVRAGRILGRGEREVMIATGKGVIQMWEVSRGGNYTLREEVDAREDMVTAMSRASSSHDKGAEDAFEVLDFALAQETNDGSEGSVHSISGETKIIALTAFLGKRSATYGLVELSISQRTATVGRVHVLSFYNASLEQATTLRPRVYLPSPGHTAFVVFAHAIAIVSVSRWPESPDQQLRVGASTFPRAFQDVIDFRDDVHIEIVGSGEEHGILPEANGTDDNKNHRRRSKYPALVALVKGGGVLRVTAYPEMYDLPPSTDAVSAMKSKILKSKIEQAIFYGQEPQNLLNFGARSGGDFPEADVEEAALEISREILDSTSKYIPTILPSMENQLFQRAAALASLASHLKQNYPPLSRVTKWRLLWDAEKLAAARAMWKNYDAQLKEKKPGDKKSLLSELYFMMSDNLKTTARPDAGESDEVRQWFIRDVARIEHVAEWLWHTTITMYEIEGKKSYSDLMPYLTEAQQVSLLIFDTAFSFRQENAKAYGLKKEPLTNDGILAKDYDGLATFWTSTTDGVQVINRIADLARVTMLKFLPFIDKPKEGPSGEKPWDPKYIKQMLKNYPRHVELCQIIYLERIGWLEAHGGPDAQVVEDTKLQHVSARRKQIMSLESLGLIREGYALSEKFADFTTLVSLVVRDITLASDKLAQPGLSQEEREHAESELHAVEQRIDRYFERYEHHWARALYQSYVQSGRLFDLLESGEDVRQQEYLTNFVRGDPRLAKLYWIIDVLVNKDYDCAGKTLIEISESKEHDLWSKKVELSLGKLSRMAALSGVSETDYPDDVKLDIDKVHDHLGIIDVQERLYRQVAPTLHGALDREAEVQLAMELWPRTKKRMPTLHARLERGVALLCNRQVIPLYLLIDLLTLVDFPMEERTTGGIAGTEFFMALKALENSGLEGKRKDAFEKLIWRRAYIREDWDKINKTELQDDEMVERATRNTAVFTTVLLGLEKDPDNFRLKDPSECFGKGINAEAYRDIKDPEVLNHLVTELDQEDAKLEHYLTKFRLQPWAQGIAKTATEVSQDMVEIRQDEDAELAQLEKKMKKGFRMGDPDEDRDTEGDVAMGGDEREVSVGLRDGEEFVKWDTPTLVVKLDQRGGISYHSNSRVEDGDAGEAIFEWY